MTHNDLVLRAEKFLNSINCKVVIRDPFRCVTSEQPDAIGWRGGISFLIEAKASRCDFLSDKNKWFRKRPERGMGDWRFYLCPPGVITVDDLPMGWGLLYCHEQKIERVTPFPANTQYGSPPFVGCKRSENQMLVSALRRLHIRGYLPEIYDGIPGAPS